MLYPHQVALKEWRNKTQEDIERYQASEEHYNRMLWDVEQKVKSDYPDEYQFLIKYEDVKALIEGKLSCISTLATVVGNGMYGKVKKHCDR